MPRGASTCVFFVCPPTHPGMRGHVHAGFAAAAAAAVLWSMGAGSGYRVLAVGRWHTRWLARASNGYLVFTKPSNRWQGARGYCWRIKCPFWMSSTQWGRRSTTRAEGQVAGGRLSAVVAAGFVLWASPPPLVGKEGGLTNHSSFKHSANCHWNSVQLFYRSTFPCLALRA